MGAAAERRCNGVYHQVLTADLRRAAADQERRRVLQIAEDCNAFASAALAYLVEPSGMRADTIARSREKRGWAKRQQALAQAHCAWVDADSRNLTAYAAACTNRARAAYKLLDWALAGWHLPAHISVPRAAATQ